MLALSWVFSFPSPESIPRVSFFHWHRTIPTDLDQPFEGAAHCTVQSASSSSPRYCPWFCFGCLTLPRVLVEVLCSVTTIVPCNCCSVCCSHGQPPGGRNCCSFHFVYCSRSEMVGCGCNPRSLHHRSCNQRIHPHCCYYEMVNESSCCRFPHQGSYGCRIHKNGCSYYVPVHVPGMLVVDHGMP